MILNQPDWQNKLANSLIELCDKRSVNFRSILPKDVPFEAGVILITKVEDDYEIPYWIECADNIRHRIQGGLLMSGMDEKGFFKELIDRKFYANLEDAKQFLREKCILRWLRIKDNHYRNALTHFSKAILIPKCGMIGPPQASIFNNKSENK
ncbi:MAG: hypothetical protein P9X24_03635 [Candidatus Hatepunaea meridiana]|nr:hypothetical protein [Candidatus Hatepunaea meridiana]